MKATRKMANYIRSKGISIKFIADATNLTTGVLYPSLKIKTTGRIRPLRVDEFLAICAFLEVDPFDFQEKETNHVER